ncbi:hypothetical protein ACS0TY_016023 [Phlomoides rotata]
MHTDGIGGDEALSPTNNSIRRWLAGTVVMGSVARDVVPASAASLQKTDEEERFFWHFYT